MLDITHLRSALRHENGLSRRLFLAYGAALASLPIVGARAVGQVRKAPKFAADPFALGVASGDPDESGFVLWTKLAPRPLDKDGSLPADNIEVHWEVANDQAMKNVVKSGTAIATPKLGHTLHVEVEGLKPNYWYWYRFRTGGADSPIGHARTMPEAGATPDKLRLAFASCQNYEHGLFTAYEHMAKDELDLVFHLGDYIYEGAPRDKFVRKHIGPKLLTLADYRLRHCQYRADPLLHRMHARCPWIVTWDDHEVENNYAGDIPEHKSKSKSKNKSKSKSKTPSKEEFLAQRAAAYQAYYEMMPLRTTSVPSGPNMRLYRTISFGRMASFQVLDTRQYRTDQPNGDKPSDLNQAAMNPQNTLLGARQGMWLKDALARSTAIWNVLAQQVMMGLVDIAAGPTKHYSMDKWAGAAYERMQLVKFIGDKKVSNPVVLTGDIHSNWVNELRVDDRKIDTPVIATEFVGTSISSAGNGTAEAATQKELLAENPFVKFHNCQRGYVRCTVTPGNWRSDYIVVEDILKPGCPAKKAASFVVEAGRPGVKKA